MLSSPNIWLGLNVDFHEIASRVAMPDGYLHRIIDISIIKFGGVHLTSSESSFPSTISREHQYADPEVPYTRIHEFRHARPYSDAREFLGLPRGMTNPIIQYPIAGAEDKSKLAQYKEIVRALANVVFAGGLGSYKYIDMHQVTGPRLEPTKSGS